VLQHACAEPTVSGWPHADRLARPSAGLTGAVCCTPWLRRAKPDSIAAFARWPRWPTASPSRRSPGARVARSTVHRWIARYLAERGPAALAEGRRSGRPRAAAALTTERLRQLLTSDPRQFGYAANTWTVPLLATHLRAQGLAISARTLRRRIRAARFRWKRPRYVYRERAAHVGAKKGGSSDG
jgi:transposase